MAAMENPGHFCSDLPAALPDEITQQLLTGSESTGQTVIICTVPPGSPSAEALNLLIDVATDD